MRKPPPDTLLRMTMSDTYSGRLKLRAVEVITGSGSMEVHRKPTSGGLWEYEGSPHASFGQ